MERQEKLELIKYMIEKDKRYLNSPIVNSPYQIGLRERIEITIQALELLYRKLEKGEVS